MSILFGETFRAIAYEMNLLGETALWRPKSGFPQTPFRERRIGGRWKNDETACTFENDREALIRIDGQEESAPGGMDFETVEDRVKQSPAAAQAHTAAGRRPFLFHAPSAWPFQCSTKNPVPSNSGLPVFYIHQHPLAIGIILRAGFLRGEAVSVFFKDPYGSAVSFYYPSVKRADGKDRGSVIRHCRQ